MMNEARQTFLLDYLRCPAKAIAPENETTCLTLAPADRTKAQVNNSKLD